MTSLHANTICRQIRSKVEEWIRLEKDNNQSMVRRLLGHLEHQDKLRAPQKEAVETYLWIKFIGKNKKLSTMVKEGLLYDDTRAREYHNYHTFKGNFITQFLNHFFEENGLKNLHKKLVNDPDGKKTDWASLLEELLHNFDYPNYLYSLPMGAGKTFLMACFIYLDLYFASLFKKDQRFAHNFIVFAPHSSKTAILPALKTIKYFNPEWILPENDAQKLKHIISIEILDGLSSRRKDKLHGNNPNLEKVNRIKQAKHFGIVFITNAEKVVLEKYLEGDKSSLSRLRAGTPYIPDIKISEDIKKTNELRESLSQIPNLTVILDEVHHSYRSIENKEKKLRQAVNILNRYNNINSVLGLSGTPYVKSRLQIGGEKISLSQIQDIVYNYPLNMGIGKFLKEPNIRKANIKEDAFIKRALSEFFTDYDRRYQNGTTSKIAFYCPSIKALNDDVLPLVKEWYRQSRPGKEDEIFRHYSNVDKKNRQYVLAKDSLAIFNNLDKPYSKKRVILLVAVGTEGWNCRSLTSVVLPRQGKTAKNFVLQTTCRCLREVDNAAVETALVYLSEDNYATLDRELRDNYQLSISDLASGKEQSIKVQVRKPKLGKLKYKQIDIKYKIVKKISPEVKEALMDFEFPDIKKSYCYEQGIVEAKLGRTGLTAETRKQYIVKNADTAFSFSMFLHLLADAGYGLFSENEMEDRYAAELNKIYKQINKNAQWIELNPHIGFKDIINAVVQRFMNRIEYAKDVIERETEIELLEWEGSDNTLKFMSQHGGFYKFMPKISRENVQIYQRHPEDLLEDHFENNNIDPQDISYNYIPYKMSSEFEQNALQEMLKLAELRDLGVHYNGYKNNKLQSFWIQTPRGKYTPDFLIVKRKDRKKYAEKQRIAIEKILIIETKGKAYYNDEFRVRERFIKDEFIKYNRHFSYHCFVDDGNNNFAKHLDVLRGKLQELLT